MHIEEFDTRKVLFMTNFSMAPARPEVIEEFGPFIDDDEKPFFCGIAFGLIMTGHEHAGKAVAVEVEPAPMAVPFSRMAWMIASLQEAVAQMDPVDHARMTAMIDQLRREYRDRHTDTEPDLWDPTAGTGTGGGEGGN